MPKFVIEREIAGVGNSSAEALHAVSQTSCNVLKELGPQIQWLESYVTDDKIYCIYIAPNQEMVREHASRGGFPANRVSEIRTIIDPTTAESQLEYETPNWLPNKKLRQSSLSAACFIS